MGNQGVRVVVACAGINLALGVLYSWHVAKVVLLEELGQAGSAAAINDLYSVTCLAYALSMILGGRLQDEFGPRATVFLGGTLVGLGFLLVAMTRSHLAWLAGFGVIGGIGIGLVYATTTPTALRWFPRTKTGLIAGIVVAGYGLAALYVTPLANWTHRRSRRAECDADPRRGVHRRRGPALPTSRRPERETDPLRPRFRGRPQRSPA